MLEPMFDLHALEPEGIRRLSRREYDRLVGLGMFEDERVELLYGVLVAMSPQGAPHATITAWFVQRLIRALDDSFDVRGHSPLAASEDSEPEPDVSVAQRAIGELVHPQTALLVIEVAESSLRKDRQIKARLYAETGMPEYWIVDLTGDAIVVEVHTEPTATGYRRVELCGAGQVLRPTRLPGIAIAVADIPWRR
jgi:Uma2 family endonuclease